MVRPKGFPGTFPRAFYEFAEHSRPPYQVDPQRFSTTNVPQRSETTSASSCFFLSPSIFRSVSAGLFAASIRVYHLSKPSSVRQARPSPGRAFHLVKRLFFSAVTRYTTHRASRRRRSRRGAIWNRRNDDKLFSGNPPTTELRLRSGDFFWYVIRARDRYLSRVNGSFLALTRISPINENTSHKKCIFSPLRVTLIPHWLFYDVWWEDDGEEHSRAKHMIIIKNVYLDLFFFFLCLTWGIE